MKNFKIIVTTDEFKELKLAWQNLYIRVENSTVFQSYEWNYQCWNNIHQEDKLFVVVFFERNLDNVSAIFPLVIDRKGVLRFIGDIHTDYCNFLIDKLSLHKLFKKFSSIINENNEIKSIKFDNLLQTNRYLPYLVSHFDNKQVTFQSNIGSSMIMDNSLDFPKSLTHLNSYQRTEIKRIAKRNHLFENKIYESPETFPIKSVQSILLVMQKENKRSNDFLNANMLNLIQELYKKRLLILNEVYEDATPVAITFVFKSNIENKFTFWISIYKNYQYIDLYSYISFMKTINFENIDNVIIDFGRGAYDFKMKNFGPLVRNEMTFFYTKKNSTYFIFLIKMLSKKFINIYYQNNKKLIKRLLNR